MRGSACGRFFFFFSWGTDWNLFKLLTISQHLRPSTRFIPAIKNHFLLPLSKITLPERDGSMHEHFKQRHCSNTWSNKQIWSVTIQPIVWSMVRKWFLQLRYCSLQRSTERCYVFFSEVNGIRRNLLPWYWIMCLIHKYMSALWKILMIEGKFLKRNKRSFFLQRVAPFSFGETRCDCFTTDRCWFIVEELNRWRISKKNLRFFVFFVFQNSVIFALGA